MGQIVHVSLSAVPVTDCCRSAGITAAERGNKPSVDSLGGTTHDLCLCLLEEQRAKSYCQQTITYCCSRSVGGLPQQQHVLAPSRTVQSTGCGCAIGFSCSNSTLQYNPTEINTDQHGMALGCCTCASFRVLHQQLVCGMQFLGEL